MLKVNIISQLLSFFVLAITLNNLSTPLMLIIVMLLVAGLLTFKTNQFFRLIKRLKWFFLVMLLIFSFNTPGEHLQGWPFTVSPTYEGLLAGFDQTIRIITTLAALSLILAANTKQQLIAGFYVLFSPLKCLGFKVERFAARLWLTLHYVESQNTSYGRIDLMSRLKNMTALNFEDEKQAEMVIVFEAPQFNKLDILLILILIFVLISLMLKAYI